ncbi:MAG: relaxase/mobilization nuclease domain-containing protein [Ruminococcus sp.]|nr:relaxase/mobilization nuclease domain-containing protein [Ruminococcus sp.]
MAVIQNIPESKQTPSAQKSLMKYCVRPDKTNLNEKVQLVSGHNCVPELAHKSFLATQALYKAEQEKHIADDKDNILFYQYVQSFSPKDKLTPEQAHEIGMQFVREYFPKHEVLVATHLDNNQLHNHFVINATSFKDGSKLHMNKYTLADMRRLNDEICLAHGLSVLKPYDPSKPSLNLGQREYRAYEKGQSWKFDLLYVITDLMKTCGSKDEFINKLKDKGYDVRWQEHQKTMTYTCPNGMKVRDNKLHDTRFLKEAMEREFRIREQCLEQLARLAEGEGQGNIRETISTDGLRYPEGAVGADAVAAEGAVGIQREIVHSDEAAAVSEGNRELHERDAGRAEPPVQGADGRGEGERPTGWEQSREVYFRSLVLAAGAEQGAVINARQDNDSTEMVHDSGGISLDAAVGAGICALLALADLDSSDDPEEQRRRYEAYLATQNLIFVMNIIVKLLEKFHEIDERRAANVVRNEVVQQEDTSSEQEEQQEVNEQEETEEQGQEQQIDEQTM